MKRYRALVLPDGGSGGEAALAASPARGRGFVESRFGSFLRGNSQGIARSNAENKVRLVLDLVSAIGRGVFLIAGCDGSSEC